MISLTFSSVCAGGQRRAEFSLSGLEVQGLGQLLRDASVFPVWLLNSEASWNKQLIQTLNSSLTNFFLFHFLDENWVDQ